MTASWSLLVPAALVAAALATPVSAQAPGRWGCRVDSLSGFNCAQYYDGTVTLVAELKGTNVQQTFRAVATVTGGRVRCRVTGSEVGDFEGAGMIAVTHASSQTLGGGYEVNIWCPESSDQAPHRGSSPLITILRQHAADYATLQGREAHEHPDTDAANGLTGTETITWTLRRP